MTFVLVAFSSLFSIINPLSAAPLFVSLTEGRDVRARRRIAWLACLAAGSTLVLFAAAGGLVFSFFGVTVPAFQIAGGLLFGIYGIRALTGGDDKTAAATGDPAVVPLGIPTIAGPGAISTVMVLAGQAPGHGGRAMLVGAIAANIVVTLVVLLGAPAIVRRLGVTGQRVVAQITGLITAVIGVQLVINGVGAVLGR